MKKKFVVNPGLCIFSIFLSIFFAAMCIVMLRIGRPGSAAFFGVLLIPFVYLSVFYGASVEIDEEGIIRYVLGRPGRTVLWNDLREVGIVGLRLFYKGKKNRTGTKYLYFSEKEMTEEERFKLTLEWPPARMLFVIYSPECYQRIHQLWGKKIEQYNVSNMEDL